MCAYIQWDVTLVMLTLFPLLIGTRIIFSKAYNHLVYRVIQKMGIFPLTLTSPGGAVVKAYFLENPLGNSHFPYIPVSGENSHFLDHPVLTSLGIQLIHPVTHSFIY